jgi:NADPH-dependent 2,4-dienoyl-CoA reductase/sulfur reductase-like enzyme
VSHIVIIGAGQAGARAALALREQQFNGAITLVGDEPYPPYERPPLSKDVLVGRAGATDALVHPESGYSAAGIRLLTGRPVRALDTAGRRVLLADGGNIAYDKLILATGARARALELPGAQLPGVHCIRSAPDAAGLRAALLGGARKLVVIGGGFVGLEAAASARSLGLEVTILEQASICLGRVLPAASAQVLADLHCSKGVRIQCGAVVDAVVGEHAVAGVRSRGGEVLEADIVVAGIGSVPNIELAKSAGIACGDGVLTDFCGRTSQPDIFAIGDVAQFQSAWSHGRALRLESWDNAERQARLVADVLIGREPSDTEPPWFWTDQYDWNVQMIGLPSEADSLEVRPGGAAHQVSHLYMRGNRLCAAVLFNRGRERRPLTRLIAEALPLNPAQLTDPAMDLRRIA